MTSAKEFRGKTLDEAIETACSYYGVKREKLEIEIVNDSKTGIFGLVNVKKACIRATKVSAASFLEETLSNELEESPKEKVADKSKDKSKEKSKDKNKEKASKPTSVNKASDEKQTTTKEKPAAKSKDKKAIDEKGKKQVKETSEAKVDKAPVSKVKREATPQSKKESPKAPAKVKEQKVQAREDSDEGSVNDALPIFDITSLPEEQVIQTVKETVSMLVVPIAGEFPIHIEISQDGRIRVQLDCEEEVANVLVGRDGQTLASLQYISARILGNKFNGAVRVHIVPGNYRANQTAHLQELALSLAEKVLATGRTQSTRPLSAYQRRIIHLALEENDKIQTNSKGEGAQRRVLIQLSKKKLQKSSSEAEAE